MIVISRKFTSGYVFRWKEGERLHKLKVMEQILVLRDCRAYSVQSAPESLCEVEKTATVLRPREDVAVAVNHGLFEIGHYLLWGQFDAVTICYLQKLLEDLDVQFLRLGSHQNIRCGNRSFVQWCQATMYAVQLLQEGRHVKRSVRRPESCCRESYQVRFGGEDIGPISLGRFDHSLVETFAINGVE